VDIEEKAKRGRQFRDLHARPEILVLPNPWDVGTARLLAHAGFEALATTSAGLAFSLGRSDGEAGISKRETLEHARMLVEATALPVSADLENGFGVSPESVAQTILDAAEVGLSGASIEDASYDSENPIFDFSLAVERMQAAVETVRRIPYPFTLTARAENFIHGRPNLDDTLARLTAFEKAGADVLYAPGLPSEDAIRLACSSVSKPFNYVAGVGPTRLNLEQLRALGVRRVTLGSSLARLAFSTVLDAAMKLKRDGTFDYLRDIRSVGEMNGIVAGR
jgi:2-methylisocitrate lyase-like PEP mutase family enzyme